MCSERDLCGTYFPEFCSVKDFGLIFSEVARLKMPALFRPCVNEVGRELEAKGFCFLLGIERSGRMRRVVYCDPRNPFAGLFIKSGRRNHEPFFVHRISHKSVVYRVCLSRVARIVGRLR